MIWSYDPLLNSDEVRDLIYDGCDPIVDYDPDLKGRGRVNVFNSMALASGELWIRDPHSGVANENNLFKAAIEGECPGTMTLRWEGAAPDRDAGLL